MNGNAGTMSRFAGSETSDTRPKFSASSGVVASIAAIVTEAGSANSGLTQRGSSARRNVQPSASTIQRRSGEERYRMPAVAEKLS